MIKTKNVAWTCKILKYQNQLFATRTHSVDGTFYAYMYILGDLEEAKKFKVAISVGQGTQSGIIHTGQIFPIDAKQKDIMKEKSGVLSFSSTGLGETLFEDINMDDEKKRLQVCYKIMNAQEFTDGNTCKLVHSPFSASFGN